MQRFQPMLAVLTVLSFPLGAGASLAQDGGEPLEIVAFGDSLVAGYGVGPGEAFPEQLEAALGERGYDVEVLNAGVSGDTTAGGLSRVEWSVPETADLVIVELGANDALRGVPPALTRENLDAILAKLSERDGRVLLAGMIAPPNMGSGYAAEFNPIYADLAAKYDVPLYPFFLEGVAAQVALNQPDYMHPNAAGVAVIVEAMLPAIIAELDAIRTAESTG